MALHKKFFEGRIPPDTPVQSTDTIDWYNEMARRSFEGFEYRGTRITGDHWWFLNFFPIMTSIIDKHGRVTTDFEMNVPFFSQDDDYLFKQIEEAHQSGMAVFLFTGRGYGKTYIVISIAGKLFFFKERSHSVISASGDEHANETWRKIQAGIEQININHPAISQKFLYNSTERIEAGDPVIEGGVERKLGTRSVIEKKIYDKKPGKTKGRRLDFQQFEEVGDWGGAAKLEDCIAASIGSWRVGSIIKCRVFYTGTGGVVTSTQAKKLFFNPNEFDIYPVTEWKNRKTGILIPAYKKVGGLWEQRGFNTDEEGKAYHDAERKKREGDSKVLSKYKQEYPYNPEEAFAITGGNNYPQELIAEQLVRLQDGYYLEAGEFGDLDWVRKDNKVIGVQWFKSGNGPIWILEHPQKMADNQVYPHLYISGLDSIDLGESDSVTKDGSNGALAVKKRFLSSQKLNNAYVCFYVERPKDIDVFYDKCLMISYYYNCLINIEYSKVGIVGYFRRQKEEGRFMKRPRLTLADPTVKDVSKLIGTTPTQKNFEYGETFVARYLKDYWENLRYIPALEEARDFHNEFRTEFDINVAMQMAELGDDELMDKQILPPRVDNDPPAYGFYTDSRGIKRWGALPNQNKNMDNQFNWNPGNVSYFANQEQNI